MERTSLRPALPWLAATLALGISAIVIGVVRLDALPDPYPVHFTLDGAPDRYAARSLGTVLMPAVLGQLSAMAVFATLLLVRRHGHPRLVTPLAAMGFVVGGGISAISVAQYLSSDAVAPGWGLWLLLVGIALTTGWVVVAAVRAGREAPDDRTGWRLGGLVYANPDDPDVFITKRMGVGVTINFGRPTGWLVMGLLLLPAVVVVVISLRLS